MLFTLEIFDKTANMMIIRNPGWNLGEGSRVNSIGRLSFGLVQAQLEKITGAQRPGYLLPLT